ncbi:alpha-mannosidase [Paenibacillus alkalitolerans]|uniref:alpha-mannosidase n=1 Tax=Paenibacillus alkalitolerans TaxID=2799335 RepID=UPI0018F58A84|nr:alpha-mannosidase [Paenibacillus alkalitolerans]
MFWTEEKLQARIAELEPYRYRDAIMIERFRAQEDPEGTIGAYPSEGGSWANMRISDEWKGRDKYLWLAADPFIPSEWRGRQIVGRFDYGTTGGGNNSGFESLLFVDGHPYQGVDSNHTEVFLPDHKAGQTIALRFRLWSGLNGYGKREDIAHKLQHASVCWLDRAADDVYYTGKAVLDTVKVLGDSAPIRHALLDALDRSFLRIDWSRPGSDTFYASVSEARRVLNEQLEQMSKSDSYTVTCVGHTHIDVAWLWTLRHTREKAARSFSTVLRLMEQYPEYVFLQTQPQLYDYMRSDYPEIYAAIKERIREGRWEASGAMWLEADCNIPSGESLVRQLLYGTRFLREQFGVECAYLWLPDVFGYSWALPQILVKSGITAFMTTKISWNQYNRMPHDTFYWRGIDGSEILAHFITTPDPGGREGRFYYTYNGVITPETVTGIWEAYRDKPINRNLLLAYGYGDGGGGVNREMLEMRRRLDRLPGLPKVTAGRADAYFTELKQTVDSAGRYVHTWDGELYLELHRGTYTSQAYNKRANRKLELLYRECEWLHAFGAVLGRDWSSYPAEDIRSGWTIVLRNQFHDIIPGSSIREVYEDSRREYGEAERIGRRVWNEAAARLAVSGPTPDGGKGMRTYTVFNGAPWERDDIVRIERGPDMAEHGCWHAPDGAKLPSQRCGDGWYVRVGGIPPMGFAAIRYEAQAQAPSDQHSDTPFVWSGQSMQTPFYDISWDGNGHISRLYDKQARRDVLAAGGLGNELQVFEDKPKSRHEAWDIDIFYSEKMNLVTDLVEMRLAESGPLLAAVEFVWCYGDSVIRQRMILYTHSKRIDFETNVDWHEQRQLLKVAFPVAVRATEATFDIQFGNVKRPTHWNTSWDYARFETVAHQWADLSERGFGVSLLNDCKYGYDVKDLTLRLSLIKSAMVPDETADQGEHEFTYALLPHQGDWFTGRTVQEAWSLNNPLSWVEGEGPFGRMSLFSVSADHVMIDAVKKAEDEDAVLIRLHEFSGASGRVKLSGGLPFVSWTECDLMERAIAEPVSGPVAEFDITPYEIKTFLVKFADR